MFAKDFPEKLRSTILTSQVVGKKVKLKQHGREFQGLCPFHNEKTPSFSVNDQKGFYHCFGCGAHGDIITFTMKTRGLDFKDAVEDLANEFSIEIPRIKFDQAKENKLQDDYALLEEAARFFEKNLYGENGGEARKYLQKRGLNSIIAKKFRLGFAPNSYNELHKFLLTKGFQEAQLLRSGIIAKNDAGKIYDKFRNRIIFPILDKKNRVIAFGGRCLGDDLPKYLNSAETEIFKKNQTLYNYSQSRKAIFDKGFAIIVEGYMDVISVASAGVENVVAALGTALGSEHLKELFYSTDKIVICLDGDAAGIKAARRAAEIALPLISAKKTIALCFLPNAMDPDEFIKKFGATQFLENINAAEPLSESLLRFACQDLKLTIDKKISAEDKAKIEAILSEKIALIKDNSLKKYFTNSFKQTLFYWDFGKKKKSEKTVRKFTSQASAIGALAILLKNPDLKDYRDEYFDIRESSFYSEKLTILKDEILEMLDEKGAAQVLANLDTEKFASEISEIKNILASIDGDNLEYLTVKFRFLLLKDLLLQIDEQYRESIIMIDDNSTSTAINDPKIQEIFNHKKSIEKLISDLEQKLIN